MRKNERRLAVLLSILTWCRGATAPAWDTFSDTWVATDALGRALPAHEQTGPPRAGKSIGIFYFLWLGEHGQQGPFDISKILTADPAAMQNPTHPLWGPLQAPHHWGESIFGYYLSNDEGVLAKHAQMLADAQVDAVIFDVTNQHTYPRSYLALCRASGRLRQAGNRVPQIAFLCPFWSPDKVVRELYAQLYGPGLHRELWFEWDGKPLILANPDLLTDSETHGKGSDPVRLAPGHSLGQSFTAGKPVTSAGGSFPTWTTTNSALIMTVRKSGPIGEVLASRRCERIQDNAWLSLDFHPPLPPGAYYLEISGAAGTVGWWSGKEDTYRGGQAFADGQPVAGDRRFRLGYAEEETDKIRRFFTFRKPQPDYFKGPQGPGEWGWLEVYPQHAFYKTPGVPEQVTVGVAQNAVDGKLSVLSNPRAHGRSFHQGRQPEPENQDFYGRNFAEQWERARKLDPAFIFITGWNEWIAGRFDSQAPFYGAGPVSFVDQFNREYSRDCEPMKGGHGDAFYYQMIDGIRRFKGTRPLPAVNPAPIRTDGLFEDWAAVTPEFRDTLGDPVRRDHPGWGNAGHYRNLSGRHDLAAAKVSWDERQLYLYARITGSLGPRTNSNWMLLFLDTDGQATNGWLGYDFVLNRFDAGKNAVSVERHQGPGYRWQRVGQAELHTGASELEMAVSWKALGLPRPPAFLDFKWADNLRETGEASDFTLHGDAAPNDRYNYRAKFNASKP